MRRTPSAVQALPDTAPSDWDGADFTELLERARNFRRVGPQTLDPPENFLRAIVDGLFGARADTEGGRFALAPWLPEGWRTLILRRLRCHRTLVSVELRPRAEWVTLRLEREFGPAIPLAAGIRNAGPIARLSVDEVALTGERAIFTLQGQHEIVFFLSGGQDA